MKITNKRLFFEYWLIKTLKITSSIILLFFAIGSIIKGEMILVNIIGSLVTFISGILIFCTTMYNYICISDTKIVFRSVFRSKVIILSDTKQLYSTVKKGKVSFIFQMLDGSTISQKIGTYYDSVQLFKEMKSVIEKGEMLEGEVIKRKNTFINNIHIAFFFIVIFSFVASGIIVFFVATNFSIINIYIGKIIIAALFILFCSVFVKIGLWLYSKIK